MRGYRLSRPAKADLDQIWLLIARDADIEKADRFIDSITDRFPMLSAMPEAGRASDEIEQGLRRFPAGNYLIYYRRASRGGILISRVMHGMRDQRKARDNNP